MSKSKLGILVAIQPELFVLSRGERFEVVTVTLSVINIVKTEY
jgi:hypothetical protein